MRWTQKTKTQMKKDIRNKDFVKYGRFDTIEHARNGTDNEKIAKARLDLYNTHKKAKEMLNGKL